MPVIHANSDIFRLKQVHFDLCYDVSTWSMYSLTVLSRKTIRNFSVSLLYEDEVHFNVSAHIPYN